MKMHNGIQISLINIHYKRCILTVAGTESSCLAPWFDTTMPAAPCFTASIASSAVAQIVHKHVIKHALR